MENAETINSRLVERLVKIPFPYSDILQEQINVSSYTNTILPDYYCIHFQLEKSVSPLPYWLDTMPLSWQILADGAPILCQLFINKGYIEKLEIIDFALRNINWVQVWTNTPLLDYEYDIQSVMNYLAGKEVVISKVLHVGTCVDLSLELGDKHFVASFRECQVRKLISEGGPKRCLLSINDLTERNGRFTVLSSIGDIDFDCALIFIQWHKVIG